MKCLKDFEADLNKCSKCGLCQGACPLFELTQNECVVSKGKFIMLHGVATGKLKLSKNINKYLDMCLKCGKCNSFCPSAIDVTQILNVAKYEYMHSTLLGKLINFCFSREIMGTILKIGKTISKPFRPPRTVQEGLNVVYFKGCVNQVCPRTDNYLNKIFKNYPINIIEPDFECCGLPFLSEGNLKRFEQAAKHNLELLEGDFDYLVTDCASCESTLSDYSKYFPNSKTIPDEKSINWGNLIALKGIKFKFNKPVTVTFHKPCHLKNDYFLTKILENCENVSYIEMNDYDTCCGFSGSFSVKNRKLSLELSKKKAQNIKKTNADYVITTCPACILGLKQGLIATEGKTKVISLLEFLASTDKIS